jgi:acetyl esterase/lipase
LFTDTTLKEYAMARLTSLCCATLLLLLWPSQSSAAKHRVERNVVYGMYSGLALLLDVYHPNEPNGYGVIFIAGSGWAAPLSLDAAPLKQSGQEKVYAEPLADAGYTVFAINHRATPRFQYPAALEDAQRAVRFVRHHAERFGVNNDRIGAVGGSSGGHLVSLLGTLDGQGIPDDPDPLLRESAKVQCVVARAAPVRLSGISSPARVLFVGMVTSRRAGPNSIEARTYHEASPVNHVSSDDAPTLLIHPTVPYEQSETMRDALKKASVEVQLLKIPGGGHGPTFPGATNPPDYIGATIDWLNQHLPAAN